MHDRFLAAGSTEDTFDWYAQDSDGNVWYLGEDSREIENGQVVSTEGSWEEFGSFTGCVKTEDRNLLESGSTENKFYCPDVGTALEYPVQSPAERTELVEVSGP